MAMVAFMTAIIPQNRWPDVDIHGRVIHNLLSESFDTDFMNEWIYTRATFFELRVGSPGLEPGTNRL